MHSRAMDALDLKGRFPDVDPHGAHAHALLALDAGVFLVAVVHQQRVAVAEHPLQIAVGARPWCRSCWRTRVKSRKVISVTAAPEMPPAVWMSSDSSLRNRSRGSTKYDDEDKGQKHRSRPEHRVEQAPGARPASRSIPFVPTSFAQPRLERHRSFAEDHLRAQVSAVHPPVEDRRHHHQEHQEHQREEDDAEFVDPQLVSGEIEALAAGYRSASRSGTAAPERPGSRPGGSASAGCASYLTMAMTARPPSARATDEHRPGDHHRDRRHAVAPVVRAAAPRRTRRQRPLPAARRPFPTRTPAW